MMRVLIVDDEPIALRGMRRLLGAEPDVEIVGEAGSGKAAVAAIADLQPDLVLLDIQLPVMDGLEVVATVGPANMPAVVFVTAYDKYAVDAFDLNAADYVLKPVDPERLSRAIARARQRLVTGDHGDLEERLMRVLERTRPVQPERLVVRSAGRIQFVDAEDIDWISAEDNYVRIYAAGRTYLMRETVGGMEARLDPARFARIHRSTIVNLARIRELQPTFNGEYVVLLHSGAKLTLSRGYRDALRSRLGDGW